MRIFCLPAFHGFHLDRLIVEGTIGVDGEGVESSGAEDGFIDGGFEDEIWGEGLVGDGVEGLWLRGGGVLGCDERFPFHPREIYGENLVRGRTRGSGGSGGSGLERYRLGCSCCCHSCDGVELVCCALIEKVDVFAYSYNNICVNQS